MIEILKASAGSGKTYNLARTYIRLLLEDPDRYAYRHILAVTFTNKATAEMKSRILRELHTLSTDPKSSGYYNDFVPSILPDFSTLKAKSERVLLDILHDYSAFAVSTIDKFFQRVLKAFARELGYVASYQVDLDKESLISETVDRMLDSITPEDKDVIDWLVDSAYERMKEGKRFNLDRSLNDMGKEFKSPEHIAMTQSLGLDDHTAYAKGHIADIKKACKEVIDDYLGVIKEAATQAMKALKSANIGIDEAVKNNYTALERYCNLVLSSDYKAPAPTFLSCCEDPKTFFKKANQSSCMSRVDSTFGPALARIGAKVKSRARDYATAVEIIKNIHSLGIAREFYQAFDELVKEKNIMSLDDANTILKRIIDESDAPFVYEKIGVRFEHFLLDEFQDTSLVQWDNFRPLLRESDSYGRDDLVVGDVKQSIYRFRGSDWDLLAHKLPEEFPQAQTRTLEDNYRSLREIVEFNNSFFTFLAGRLDERFKLSGDGSMSDIYSDVRQNVKSKDPQSGYVKLEFCDSDEDECKAIVESIHAAIAAGACYRDIAVLVRGHKSGYKVANALIMEDIPVITDDSMGVKSSSIVRRLVSLLSCVNDPSDTVNCYYASIVGLEYPSSYYSLVDLCEELLRTIRVGSELQFSDEELYIQAFMDVVQDWTSLNGNNLSEFLKYWSEVDPKIISPDDSDSVTIMTIHKSKGLQFPYVIFPFTENVGERKTSDNIHWCHPDIKDGPLIPAADLIYPINVSGQLKDTYFASSDSKDEVMTGVDDLNIFYVAFTRAEKCLHIISKMPVEKDAANIRGGGHPSKGRFNGYLYQYSLQHGEEFGQMYDFVSGGSKPNSEDSGVAAFEADYPTFALGSRLAFSTTDASSFFDTPVSTGDNARLRGIVMHDILSRINALDELRGAVDEAVLAGDLTSEEGELAYSELYERVSAHLKDGWFTATRGEEASRNEVSILDTSGQTLRPDRVVILPDGEVKIIDYKFGAHRAEHRSQVLGYMSLYSRMGYKDVQGYLWYVDEDSVETVE